MVYTLVTLEITLLWYVTPCRLYKGTYFLGPHLAIKTIFSVF